jgi:phosphate/sulfate permease
MQSTHSALKAAWFQSLLSQNGSTCAPTSWVISPVLSGVLAVACYAVTKRLVIAPPWRTYVSERTMSYVNGGVILFVVGLCRLNQVDP